jgi:hypothetical protein
MRLGGIATATGAVTPLSLAGGKVTLSVQLKMGAIWVKVKATYASISPKARYSWRYAPAQKGAYRMRTQLAASAAYPAATTPWRGLTVK